MSGEPDLPPLGAEKLGPVCESAAPSPGEHVYWAFGVRTLPAPPDTVTAITVADAKRLVDGLWPGEPEIELRQVTTGDFCEPPPDRLLDRPAWVFTYRDTTVVLHGRNRARPAGPFTGVSTVIIDAGTGALVLNGQSSDGPDR